MLASVLSLGWRQWLAVGAILAAFGAGWQVSAWRSAAGFAAERLAWADERTAQAQERADELEARDRERNAQEAKIVALRRDYTELQGALDAIPDTGTCGLDVDRVRILDGIR